MYMIFTFLCHFVKTTFWPILRSLYDPVGLYVIFPRQHFGLKHNACIHSFSQFFIHLIYDTYLLLPLRSSRVAQQRTRGAPECPMSSISAPYVARNPVLPCPIPIYIDTRQSIKSVAAAPMN